MLVRRWDPSDWGPERRAPLPAAHRLVQKAERRALVFVRRDFAESQARGIIDCHVRKSQAAPCATLTCVARLARQDVVASFLGLLSYTTS